MHIAFDHEFGPFGPTKAEINKNGIVFITQKNTKTGKNEYAILTPEQIKQISKEMINRNAKISRAEFTAICEEYTVDPRIALENDDVAEAIKTRNRKELREILKNEF